jgi:hypothetical protein
MSHRPVHVLYGGAHLYKVGTAAKLAKIARASLADHAKDGAVFARRERRGIGKQGVRRRWVGERTAPNVAGRRRATDSDRAA